MRIYQKIVSAACIAALIFILLGAGTNEQSGYETSIGEVAPGNEQVQVAGAYTYAADILSATLEQKDGSRLGTVEDIVINITGGFAPYVVFSLQKDKTASKLYPIPLSVLRNKQEAYILSVEDDNAFENAPLYTPGGYR